MAGTVATTEVTYTTVKKVKFDWTASAGGAADAVTTKDFTGVIERVVFAWVDATNAYDVVVNDSDGIDVLIANGANLAQADVQKSNVVDGMGAVVNSTLTLGVTNAGNGTTGSVIIYLR